MFNNNYTIEWYKLKPQAVIPTKRAEDSGFDVYAILEPELRELIIQPHEKVLLSTGLAYNIDKNHWLMVHDRGSTGTRGLHVHAGICDQGYRGEIFVCLCNTNDFPVSISRNVVNPTQHKENDKVTFLEYPASKAIAQLIPMRLEKGKSKEIIMPLDEWNENYVNKTKRGSGKLGNSGK